MRGDGSVDECIDSFGMPARGRLRELRELSRAAAPDATEDLRWGDPAYVHEDGTILFLFSGFKEHATSSSLPARVRRSATSSPRSVPARESVKLSYTEPVPVNLLTRMIGYRIRELEIDGVKWL